LKSLHGVYFVNDRPAVRRNAVMKSVHPYLYFAGNTEEAFTYYKSVFGGEFLAVLRYKDFPGNPMDVPEEDLTKIAHIALPLSEAVVLMGTDVLPSMGRLTFGSNFQIALEPETAEDALRLFNALAEGGEVEMPLQKTEWAEKHGQCVDRFGVHWLIDYTGSQRFDMPTE
jgi:PhnB protein